MSNNKSSSIIGVGGAKATIDVRTHGFKPSK